jgi:hypothetical protein
MREIYKNTFAYILLIVGLIIFSHSIIPHDHHYTNVCETKHDAHHGHEDAANDPVHCHFLNDIIIDKAITYHSSNITDHLPLLFTIIYQVDEIDDNQSFTVIRFLDDDGLPNRQIFIDVSPSRGSPVLA